jgi:hypothetical protein
MKKLGIALVVLFIASGAIASPKTEGIKSAPVKMSSAEMAKVVAGKQGNWNDEVTSCYNATYGYYDCNPSGKIGKFNWNNK